MSKKTNKRIQNKDDYEKSSFKDVIEDMEDTRDKGLESLPKIKRNRFQQERKYRKKYCMVMMAIMIKTNNLLLCYSQQQLLLFAYRSPGLVTLEHLVFSLSFCQISFD